MERIWEIIANRPANPLTHEKIDEFFSSQGKDQYEGTVWLLQMLASPNNESRHINAKNVMKDYIIRSLKTNPFQADDISEAIFKILHKFAEVSKTEATVPTRELGEIITRLHSYALEEMNSRNSSTFISYKKFIQEALKKLETAAPFGGLITCGLSLMIQMLEVEELEAKAKGQLKAIEETIIYYVEQLEYITDRICVKKWLSLEEMMINLKEKCKVLEGYFMALASLYERGQNDKYIFGSIRLHKLAQSILLAYTTPDKNIFSFTEYPAINQVIHSLKLSVLKFVTGLAERRLDDQRIALYPSFYADYAIPLMFSLNSIARLPVSEFESILETPQLNEMLFRMLSLFSFLAEAKLAKGLSFADEKNITTGICLVFLRGTKFDYQELVSNPESFVNSSLDIADKQLNPTIKAAAAALLEGMCDHNEGIFTFIAQFCCNCIFSVHQGMTQQKEPDFSALSPYNESNIIKTSNTDQIVEASLLGLAIISYLASKHKRIM